MPADGSRPGLLRKVRVIEVAISIVVVVLLLVFVLAPGAIYPRFAARYSSCRNNLKLIELALHNYHETWGTFPPAATCGPNGESWHSWRVLLLPYLDRTRIYERYRFDEPWNGPNNSQLATMFPSLDAYQCPEEQARNSNACNYLAVIGERTMWPPKGTLDIDAITDPTANTLHVVEVAESGIHWMEPHDLQFDSMAFTIAEKQGVGLSSHHGPPNWYWQLYYDEGPWVFAVNVDGSIRPMEREISPKTIKSLLLRDDGGPVGGP